MVNPDEYNQLIKLKAAIEFLLSKVDEGYKYEKTENNSIRFNSSDSIETLAKGLADLLSQSNNLVSKLDDAPVKAFNSYVRKNYKYTPPFQTQKELTNVINVLMESVRNGTMNVTSAQSVLAVALTNGTTDIVKPNKRTLASLLKMKILVLNKNTLENRIETYNVFNNVFNSHVTLKPCIYYVNEEGFLRNDKNENVINLGKRIGSESSYGIAYASSGLNSNDLLRFSTKIMKNDAGNQSEVKLLKSMTDLAISGTCQNMPITYKTMECDQTCEETNGEEDTLCPELIRYDRYLVVLNEIASYDMNFFLESAHNTETFQSVVMQILFSLYSFHSLGYCHNDAHMGNFLIHKIEPNGFWHYRVVEEDVYVKNCGYLAVLWDPGMAKPFAIHPVEKFGEIQKDYVRAIGVIIYCIDKHMFDESLKSLKFLKKLVNAIGYGNYRYKDYEDPTHIQDEDSLMSYIINNIYYNTPDLGPLAPPSLETVTRQRPSWVINKDHPFTLKHTKDLKPGGRNSRRRLKMF